jgi:hypothetical protein
MNTKTNEECKITKNAFGKHVCFTGLHLYTIAYLYIVNDNSIVKSITPAIGLLTHCKPDMYSAVPQ